MSNGLFQQNTPVSAAAVTPSDTVIQEYSMLYVGGTGNVKITDSTGVSTTFTAVPAGQYIPVRTRLVWATGTTASAIVGIG